MKKITSLMVAAVVLLSGASLFADEAAAPKAEPKADAKQPMCCMLMEKFDLLTKEQKAKAEELHAECHKAGASEEAQAKFFKAVKETLTPEQIAACKTNCEKEHIKGCPMCGGWKGDAKPESKN